jgi:hypothetical protein
VYSLDERGWQKRHYDVVLCSNVLSAIPFSRVRKQLMATAYDRLAASGELLVTTQFRNSRFSDWRFNPHAQQFHDGFLVSRYGGASFYGLIDALALARLCRSVGLTIRESGHAKEVAYVIATKRLRNTKPR